MSDNGEGIHGCAAGSATLFHNLLAIRFKGQQASHGGEYYGGQLLIISKV